MTLDIVRAFDPEEKYLAERPYTNYKVKMLDWEFCKALIIGPPSIANKIIRGSAAAVEMFNSAVISVNHLFLTRKEASKELRDMLSLEDGEKKSRFQILEGHITNMFSNLSNQIQCLLSEGVENASNSASLNSSSVRK